MMKKYTSLLVSIFLFNILSFGQNNPKQPELKYDKNIVIKSKIDTLILLNYYLYNLVNTKDNEKYDDPNFHLKTNPIIINTTKSKLDTILNEIKSSIKAEIDKFSIRNEEPINNLIIKSKITLTDLELLEYKKNFFGTSFINSYNINAHIINYNLKDEKNEKIVLFSNKLGFGSSEGTKEGEDNKLIINFTTDRNGNYKYQSIKGYIEIEVEMISKFNEVKIHKNDISNFVIVDEQKVKILEFNNNIFHYKLNSSEEPKFKVFNNRCRRMSLANLSEEIYYKFKRSPGLSFNEFKSKFKDLKFDNSNSKNIYIYKGDKCNLNNIYFYYADEIDKLKKVIKIPVDIQLN